MAFSEFSLPMLSPSLVLTALCVFCLVSLLIYGGKIYKEMKRIEVSRNIIIKAGHLSAVNDR